MHYRFAATDDSPALAAMNRQLILEEGHRNRITIEQLETRMADFLAGDYKAVIFQQEDRALGYALYKREPEWIYLRQFWVDPHNRRRGIGRDALLWLRNNVWQDCPRIRLDVLVRNSAGAAFWRAMGFSDYCMTMELEQSE